MPELLSPRQNRHLAALPDADYTRVASQLELVSLPLGQSIYESGDTIDHIYFPFNCIPSLLYVMKNGASAEIAVQVIKVPGILPTAAVIMLALGAFLSFKAYRRGA